MINTVIAFCDMEEGLLIRQPIATQKQKHCIIDVLQSTFLAKKQKCLLLGECETPIC